MTAITFDFPLKLLHEHLRALKYRKNIFQAYVQGYDSQLAASEIFVISSVPILTDLQSDFFCGQL